MIDQTNLFLQDVESLLIGMIPQRFLSSISSISLVPLKSKYTDSVLKNVLCSNFRIEIKKSMYYMNGGSATLCKVSDDSVYFPELGKDGVLNLNSNPDLARLKEIFPQRLEKMFPADKFGCCGLFKKCSEQGHCVHSNAFYAASCTYKANLDAGKNFYREG